MSNREESPRFRWPFPNWKADWLEWQQIFRDLVNNIDATVFSTMEMQHLVIDELPTVEIVEITPGSAYRFTPAAEAVFISRTNQTEIRVAADNLDLEPESFIAIEMTAGAVGTQSTSYQLIQNGMGISPNLIPIGYVRSDYTIFWYNGSYLSIGSPKRLFSFDTGTGGGDTVKVSGVDTTADYLSAKLVAGAGISLAVVNPGANEDVQITATGGTPTGYGNVYVDWYNGDDPTGDGSRNNPYKTIAYAFAQIGDATDVPTFETEWTINVAPGTYSANLAVPKRKVIRIVGDGFEISGDITWYYDKAFMPPLAAGVTLTIEALSRRSGTKISGNIEMKNDNPASGGGLIRTLYVENVEMYQSDVINEESGGLLPGSSTGQVLLVSVGCNWVAGLGTGIVGGRMESDPGADDFANTIVISMINSTFMHSTYGCASFYNCSDSIFMGAIDYDADPIGGGGGYGGNIGGFASGFGGGGNGFQNCQFLAGVIGRLAFGYDSGKAYVAPYPIYLDEFSLNSMWSNNAILTPSFTNMEVMGGYVGTDSAVSDSVIWVQNTGHPESNATKFLEAYGRAVSRRPNGQSKSATNRVRVMVPEGDYLFTGVGIGWDADHDFIDVIGMGGHARASVGGRGISGIKPPGVHFAHNIPANIIATFSMDDALIEGIDFDQRDDNIPAVTWLMTAGGVMGANVKIIGCSFQTENAASPSPIAFGLSSGGGPGGDLGAYFEECHADNGFLTAIQDTCSFRGRCIRCTGGDYSWSSFSGPTLEVGGYYEDCHGGGESFAGDCIFEGWAVRCSGGAGSFAGVPVTSQFNGTAEDCEVFAGSGFGVGMMGDSRAKLIRCRAFNLQNTILFDGQMDGCKFKTTAAEIVVEIGANTPRFRRCEFETGGGLWVISENMIGPGTPCKMTHCSMNQGTWGYISPTVTNLIGVGFNVTDPLFAVE